MKIEHSEQQLRPGLARLLSGSAIMLFAGAVACLSIQAADPAPATEPAGGGVQPLRVAICPDYQPLIFRQTDGTTNGVEVDLAQALGAELGRPIKFVELRREQLITAVVENEADIVMSGMSITRGRQLRVAFSQPYLRSQLRAIFRQKDAAQYKSAQDVMKTTAKVGVMGGTTADAFVVKNCTNATKVVMNLRRDVANNLVRGARLDVYIDDTFALAPMLAENEAELSFLRTPLSEEELGWAVRQSDAELLAAVNRALTKWKGDGTLDRVLDRWMPYLKNFQAKSASQAKAQ